MAVPGRLRAEGRDRKIMWRGSQGAASAERHVILPDLQNEPIVFHKKLGEGNFGDVWQGKLRGTTTVAIKTIRSEDKSAFLLEAHIMAYPFPPAPPAATHPLTTRHASHTGVSQMQATAGAPQRRDILRSFLVRCTYTCVCKSSNREVVHARMFTVSCSLLSFRQEKNELFLVTEFVADGSLDRFLTENMYVPHLQNQNFFVIINNNVFVRCSGKIGTETLIQMTRDMAAGCDHLSTHGIVHRVRTAVAEWLPIRSRC
jgi:serine/threonine protein kinase